MDSFSDRSVLADLQALMDEFFRSVSFKSGDKPAYARIRELFVESGQLIRNNGAEPEVCSVEQFIRPRLAAVRAGELTEFHEGEIAEITELFGRVAHRFSAYVKHGTFGGVRFEGRGVICTQFVLTPAGWRMSSMAWDDERPGVSLPIALSRSLLELAH